MLSKINYSLTQLEYVLAVYKHGHFAKAARACFVTQPTLSMQLQKLENDLEVVLFDRSKKPILLTEIGKKLIEQIQSILFEAKKIEEIINLTQGQGLRGILKIGVIPTIAPYLLPKLLPQMRDHFFEIECVIQELQTHQIIDALNADEIDVGILATPLRNPQIHERVLFTEPFSVLCGKDHAISKAGKIKYSGLHFDDIWLLEEGHCLRHQVLDVCSLKRNLQSKRKIKFESGSLETLKNLIDSFGGYTLLPAMATDHIGANTKLVSFERPIPAREIGLVFRREHHKKQFIDALAESILKSIPESIRKLRQKDLDVLPIE